MSLLFIPKISIEVFVRNLTGAKKEYTYIRWECPNWGVTVLLILIDIVTLTFKFNFFKYR